MLSAEALKEIDRAVAKYPADQKQSAVMAALAVYLDMPPVWVEEVATFYNMYDTKPVGRFKLSVCTNLPCALSGGERAADYLKKKLGIGFNETTADGNFTLKEGECMGACGDAPVMIVNNTNMCSFMSNEKLDALIADLQAKAATNGAGK
jgi:NADH-quinone oxidoreductase subunit E